MRKSDLFRMHYLISSTHMKCGSPIATFALAEFLPASSKKTLTFSFASIVNFRYMKKRNCKLCSKTRKKSFKSKECFSLTKGEKFPVVVLFSRLQSQLGMVIAKSLFLRRFQKIYSAQKRLWRHT